MTPPDTCPGVLRDELTPETLRVLFQRKGNTIWQDDMLELEGNRHASAWAADRNRLEQQEAEAQDKAHPQIRPMTQLENAHMDLEGKLGQANARIEALEKTKGLVIPKCKWSICARHNRAYWTEEGGLSCRLEALERVRRAAQAVANTWRIAEGSPCVTENEAEDALVAALRGEEER